MSYKELITTIAKALVDHPDEVSVSEADADNALVIELRVAREDLGKVIGRDGRTAQSMRTLLTAASSRGGRRVHLDILD
ncbi:MAG TPA: KH domain-containing protein [Polyangiaceae bacterium]|nr:KH domain-containing protein [Polyangiaceae bacterium]